MKTVLFFYTDVLFDQEKCEAYITPASNVKNLISWKRKCFERDIKEGYITTITVNVIDKIDLSMSQTC